MSRAKANIATQLIEYMNREQNTCSQLRACKKFRKPQSYMVVCLERDLIAGRHQYANVRADAPAPVFASKISKEAFTMDRASASMKFDELVSTSSTPAWWSPGVGNMTVPCADLGMLLWAHQHGCTGELDQCWHGEVAELSHHLALSFPRDGAPQERDWFLALTFFPKSAVLMWPLKVHRAVGDNRSYFEPALDLAKPILRPLLGIGSGEVTAAMVEWRSWLWQCRHIPLAAAQLKPAVRLFMGALGEQSLARVATRAAWWSMGRLSIIHFEKELGVGIEPGMGLFEVLWATAKHVLSCSDAEALSDPRSRRCGASIGSL